jgi:hypothetical protein
MGIEALIGVLGFVGTLLLVLVGLLNFFVFRKQLRIAREQIDIAVRQLLENFERFPFTGLTAPVS